MATRIIEVLDAVPGVARRRFSEDDKARIVSEAMMPGATVADVGRRYGVCGNLGADLPDDAAHPRADLAVKHLGTSINLVI